MKACDDLRHEHKIVLHLLGASDRLSASLRAGDGESLGKMGEVLDFLRNFVDRCHHSKEERHLFPALVSRANAAVQVEVMLSEHKKGRELVAAMAGARDAGNLSALAENLLAYRDLLVEHIRKEDGVLFPLADSILPEEEQERLKAAFDLVESEEIGEGLHERYHRLAHELAG